MGWAVAAIAQPTPEPRAGFSLMDAVEMTLRHDPNIAVAKARVSLAEGGLIAAAGPFDPLLQGQVNRADLETPDSGATSARQTSLETTLGLTKLFRTGLSLEPGVDLTRTTQNAGEPATNSATVSFTLRQPLLRGRGRAAVAAGELAAEREVRASRLDLENTIAERILAVVTEYWSTRAAARNLEILRTTEERARELLANTRKLIEADVLPAAEAVQVEADVTSKEAARIDGERTLYAARQRLGQEIGLGAGEIARLPLPGDLFPTLRPQDIPPPASTARLVHQALARRSDLRAAHERVRSSEVLLRAAQRDLEPQLDLVLEPSYTGLVAGDAPGSFFSPLLHHVPGASSTLGLVLSLPAGNSRARGERLQAEAALRQQRAAVDLLDRGIEVRVMTALDAVRRSSERLEKATRAVTLFERAVANEEKKLTAGSSTLIDVISQRDRLTAARQSEVAAAQDLAQALADLRFETGTLLAPGDRPPALRVENPTDLPPDDAGDTPEETP